MAAELRFDAQPAKDVSHVIFHPDQTVTANKDGSLRSASQLAASTRSAGTSSPGAPTSPANTSAAAWPPSPPTTALERHAP